MPVTSQNLRRDGQKGTFLNLESGDLLECYLYLDNMRKFKIRNKPPAGLCPHSWADGKLVDGPIGTMGLCVIYRCRTH